MKYTYKKYALQLVKEDCRVSETVYEIHEPEAAHRFLTEVCQIHLYPQEVFLVIGLNTKGTIIGYHIVSVGDLASTPVHPREVFKFLIQCNAASTVIAHNHPSEDPNPSQTDLDTTMRLVKASEILGIHLLDHIIVGTEHKYISLKEEGML